MSGVVILLGSLIIFIIAYATYGSWLAKQWGIDPKRVTPAHEMEDGVDYIPAKSPVLLGHHFASIAGAGPINGPIQAAVFGWIPVLLWIIIGGIFFGAVQDFSSIFVSIRHQGKSLGEVIEENIGHRCKILFTIFAWLVLLLVIAAFSDIVAGTFVGYTIQDGVKVYNAANGSVATASILFIPLAIAFGFLVYRKNAPLAVSTVVGVVLLAFCIFMGLKFPIYMSKNFWLAFVFVYICIASVTPVWILLQPRDYLNSFLLYFMMIAAMIGIMGTNPTIQLAPVTSFTLANGQTMFPYLFITVACGAISGFHSLIGSGTTSKQLDNEKDAKMIGYGGMLIECFLAVIALIAVGSVCADGNYTAVGKTPAIVFATAISQFFANLGFGESAVNAAYTVISLAISAFALTSLDTGTRLGRFLFQELFAPKAGHQASSIQKMCSNMYAATIITVILGGVLCLGGYANIWPLFGACNQLVAVPAFLGVSVWLARKGKNNKMFYFPMVFMLAACLSSLLLSFRANVMKFAAGTGVWYKEGLQCVIIVPIFVLAVILVIEGGKVLIGLKDNKVSVK
ncbi:MAG: carbon starvation protein A [Lachnospiraceae bacterium]|nr:carbon starvation protein A [Lachnospiraceae bacterium]